MITVSAVTRAGRDDENKHYVQLTTTIDGASISVAIPERAIANRIAFYGLATPQEALEAILREQRERMTRKQPTEDDPGWQPSAGATKQDIAGGLTEGITITYAAGVQTMIDEVLAGIT